MEEPYLVPDYFPAFSCKMGACRRPCCEGWPISVSMKDYFHLMGADCSPDLRRRLDSFVFSGNMARIDVVRQIFSWLLGKSTLLFSVISCQVISNVPSAILLSQFTDNYRDLLLGVNIGGVGTLIASLASLITFREYTKQNKGKTGYYVLLFSAFNFAFLIILAAFVMLINAL